MNLVFTPKAETKSDTMIFPFYLYHAFLPEYKPINHKGGQEENRCLKIIMVKFFINKEVSWKQVCI